MACMARWLVVAGVLLAHTAAWAQPPASPFRPRYSFASVRLHRDDLTAFNEPKPDPQLLDRWHTALTKFREVAALVAEQKFSAAGTRLNLLARELPSPYSDYAARFHQDRLDTLIQSELRGFKQFPSYRFYLKLGQICCDLGDRELGVRLLQVAVVASPPRDADLPSIAADYRPFALTELELAALERKLSHPATLEYIRAAQAELQNVKAGRPIINFDDVQPSLGMVLSALDAKHGSLTMQSSIDERLSVCDATIAALSDPAQEAERDAWQIKLLVDFPHAHESCARVYMDRGERAYRAGQREVALVSFQKLCRYHALSSLHGKALYNIGLILQQRHQYNEAIDAYERVFPTNDPDIVPSQSLMSMPRNLRHDAAKRLAECYEARRDLGSALDWFAVMKTKYPVRHWCGECAAQIHADENAFEARLLAKAGRPKEAVEILEHIGEDGFEPEEASNVARILVERFHQANQLPVLEKRLAAIRREHQPSWMKAAQQAIAEIRAEQSREFEPHISTLH